MKQFVTFILLGLISICGYAQTIDPVLLEEMGQRRSDEKIKVFVIMRQQYDQQQLNRSAAQFTTRTERREFVVNELKQFAETSQYDLRHSLSEMQRNELVSEPQVLWIANAIFFEATRDAILSLADRNDIMVIGFDEERNWLPDGEEARPADPTREITSNVTQVNANQVWNLGYTGQGVVVAVIDTGVNYNHLDLADHLWDGGTEFPHHGYDVYNNDNNPLDDHGHGTHCAGTVCGDGTAGSHTGIAPDATLMCVKCLSSSGRCKDSHVISAMQWAVDHGCDVISMSLGGHGHSGAAQTLHRNTCVNVLNAGVIASIAAGNEGDDMDMYPIPDNVGLPGGCPPPYLDSEQAQNPGGLSCSVCVGAVNSNDQAAYFTSHGPRDWSESDYADYPYSEGSPTEFGLIRPDVCAPGVYIKSADYSGNNGYTTMSGTSMATPCVAGCMALMLSKDINTTPADVCRILEETAVPLSTGKSNIYGYGRVDVLAAVNAMYTGPLTLESFVVDDGQGNNDGKLNAGESVILDFTLRNDSDVTYDGATIILSTESEFVTITDGTATLPYLGAGQTLVIDDLFSFSLSNQAPPKRAILFTAEIYVGGEFVGFIRFGIMVYGYSLRFVEAIVFNDGNGNGSLDTGETADLHIVVSNNGNEPVTSLVGTLSNLYPYLTIINNTNSLGDIEPDGQASVDYNIILDSNAPESSTIELFLDFVDSNNEHSNLEFEICQITHVSNLIGAGTMIGEGRYGQGQTCTITASASNGYAFVCWTLEGEIVSYLPNYSFTVIEEAEYVANFIAVTNGVVVGEGTAVSENLPCNSDYGYNYSQQIYTAEEMGINAGEISSVSFFNVEYSLVLDRELTIYMVNTTKAAFDSNTDWITVTEADQVFKGSVTFASGSWTTIYFNTPFNYDGISNIALIIDDNSRYFWSPSITCRVSPTEYNQSIYINNNNINYNPYDPTGNVGTLISEKNHIIFGFPSYDYTITVTANPTNGGIINGGGLYYYGQPITLTATANDGYVFINWTKGDEIVSYFSTYNLSVTETTEYVANFQQVDGIVIGGATAATNDFPTNSNCSYSLSQQIYTTEEMGGEACEISSVAFFNTGNTISRNISIFMVNTNKTTFESTTDWIGINESDLMFNGVVTMVTNDWTTIYFNTPFVYDGSSNVALVVDDNTGGRSNLLRCRTFDTEENQALCVWENNINPNPYDSTDYTALIMENNRKNQIILGIPSYDYTVTVSVNPNGGGTVSGGGLCYYGQPVTLTATPNEGYIFTNWTKDGEVVSYVSNYILTVTESAEYVANFEMAPDGIVIGDATYTSSYLPTYYYYSLSEQIYTSAELGNTPCQISSVSFFNTGSYNYGVTRNMNVYMVNTDKTSFEGFSDWIPVTENNLVFSGNATFSAYGWVTIYFNTPFNYDGVSNVALIVDDNSNSYNGYTSCRTFDTEGSQAIRIYSSNIDYDPYAPAGYTGTLMSTKNQVIFGIPSYGYTVTVSADPEESGMVSVNDSLYYYGQTCTITAIPNEGYCFANWTENGTVVSFDANYSFVVTKQSYLIAHFVSEGNIDFVDDNVKAICVSNWDTNHDGELSYVEAASVISLGEVFMSNTEITSFEELQYFINLTTISDNAFFYCRNLTSLTIPNSITSIGEFAFCQCNNMTGTLTIPNSVTTIGICAFYGCRSLTGSLIIPNSVTTIGNQAFRGCSGFTGSLIISNSITEIDYYTFYGCSGLSGSLTLPNTITSIGDYAFYNCRNLTGSLTIPNPVTIIGESAFRGCSGFTGSLTISDSITEIGNYAFYSCSGLSGLLTIPNSITSIGDYTFYNCRNLTSLIIPNAITLIDDNAFYGCSGLKSMYIYAETPPIIGANAYNNVANNIQVYVPCEAVEFYQVSEGWNGFSNILGMCSGIITVVSDPIEGGEAMGSGSYEGGTYCTVVATPNEGYCFVKWTENGNVVSLDSNYSFIIAGEKTLTAHFVLDGNIIFADPIVKAICVANWDTNGDGELSILEAISITNLGEVFRGNTGITSFEELQYFINLTSINNYAFSGCIGLTSLTIPNSVTSIGSSAFSGCSGLTGDLTIPNSVTSIGNYAFYNCSGFTGNLTISKSVTSIGNYAFYNCNGLTGDLTIPNSVTLIGNYAFQKCSGFTGNLTISNSVSSIGEYAFSNCGNLTGSLTIPSSVTTIGKGAFYYCSGLNGSLIIPNTVTSIGSSAFSGCSNLTGSLIIPNTITSINYGTFSSCSSLTGSIIIPSSVTFIDDWAFNNCRGLTGSLTIPNSVETIGNYAFLGCNRLTSMIILSEMPPTIGTMAFQGVSTAIPLFVPCGLAEAYQATEGWNNFSNIIEFCLPGTITVMADPVEGGVVTGAGTYESGTFCTVTAIPNEGYRFANWIENGNVVSFDANHSFVVTGESLLTAHFVLEGNIVFADDNVKAICVANWDTNGDGELSYAEAAAVTILGEVFRGNTEINSFEELQYFTSLSTISNNAFKDCSSLTGSLIIPNTVTSIGSYAFYNCSGLTGALIIPNAVTSIGSYAFYNCTGLTGDLVIPNSVTTIGGSAFSGCSGFTGNLTIGNSVTSIGSSAFNNCSGLTGDLVIPNSVTTIGNRAFYGCSGFIGDLSIPSSVTSIGSYAFYGCSGFTGVLSIPSSVTSIGSYAFNNCRTLSSVIMLSFTVPSLGNGAFSGSNANYYIYVPYPSLDAYKTAAIWSNYKHRIFPMAYATVSGYGNSNDKWVFIASPLSDDVVPTAIDNMLLGTNYDLYQFNQSAMDEEWQNYKVENFDLVNGQGYVYANEAEVNIIFKGAFNEDETKVVSLDYDAEKANPGWNLVGNPFPVEAYIDRPYYVMNEDGTAINPIAVPASTPIPPCVGVLVKADGTGESVTFSKSVPGTNK